MGCNFRFRAAALTLFMLAPMAVLVSACGGSSTTARLRGRLLTSADLPAGWSSVATTGTPRLTSTPCLAGVAKNRTGWSYQTTAFVEGQSIPNLGEALATGAEVDRAWNSFDHELAGCHSATLVVGGTKATATIRRLAFPAIARTSAVYEWAFTSAGIRIGFDLVLFETGRYAGELTYADLGTPPTATVEAFVEAAVAKAQTGSTAPVPDAISIASAPVQSAATRLGNVAYRAIGSGPPLVLITGYSATMESWDPRFVDALAQRYRVITLDNAGVGKSAGLPAPLTIDAMADQTSALIDTLHVGRADVLGWSMGGMIAQALTIRHPNQVRRLVLCASFPGNGSNVRPSRMALNAFESGEPEQVMTALFPANQTAAQNTYLAAVSSYPATPSVPATVLAAQRQAVDAWWNGTDPAGTAAARIVVPTLIADGTADQLDPIANSHTLAGLIHRARLQLYPGAGHAFLFEDQSTFVPLIESFLGR